MDMLVMDLVKAFDTVAHMRLLSKVAGYGIRENLHRWITSFLEGRTQKVVVDGASSDPSPGTTNSDLLGGYSLKWLAPIGSEHS